MSTPQQDADPLNNWGSQFGRPKKMNEEHKLLTKRLLEKNKSVSEIAKTFNVHKAAIYRLKNVT